MAKAWVNTLPFSERGDFLHIFRGEQAALARFLSSIRSSGVALLVIPFTTQALSLLPECPSGHRIPSVLLTSMPNPHPRAYYLHRSARCCCSWSRWGTRNGSYRSGWCKPHWCRLLESHCIHQYLGRNVARKEIYNFHRRAHKTAPCFQKTFPTEMSEDLTSFHDILHNLQKGREFTL